MTAILHVGVLVTDTMRALCFYRDILGLDVDPARPDLGYPGAWMWVGAQQIHLMELPTPDPVTGRPAPGGRARHQTFHFFAAGDEIGVDGLFGAELAHHGEQEIDHGFLRLTERCALMDRRERNRRTVLCGGDDLQYRLAVTRGCLLVQAAQLRG